MGLRIIGASGILGSRRIQRRSRTDCETCWCRQFETQHRLFRQTRLTRLPGSSTSWSHIAGESFSDSLCTSSSASPMLLVFLVAHLVDREAFADWGWMSIRSTP